MTSSRPVCEGCPPLECDVSLEADLRCRVPEVFLDDLGVGSGGQQGTRGGMSEGVQGDAAEAGSRFSYPSRCAS